MKTAKENKNKFRLSDSQLSKIFYKTVKINHINTKSDPKNKGSMPSARWDHKLFQYKKRQFMIGGYVNKVNKSCVPIFQIIENQPNKRSFYWKKIATSGKGPRMIYSHTLSVEDDYLYTFGGMVNDSISKDIYRLNLVDFVWQKMDQTLSRQRESHISLRIARNLVFIHGGCSGYDSDKKTLPMGQDLMLVINLETGQNTVMRDMVIQGKYPKERESHSGVQLNNRFYIYGGLSIDPTKDPSQNITPLNESNLMYGQSQMQELKDAYFRRRGSRRGPVTPPPPPISQNGQIEDEGIPTGEANFIPSLGSRATRMQRRLRVNAEREGSVQNEQESRNGQQPSPFQIDPEQGLDSSTSPGTFQYQHQQYQEMKNLRKGSMLQESTPKNTPIDFLNSNTTPNPGNDSFTHLHQIYGQNNPSQIPIQQMHKKMELEFEGGILKPLHSKGDGSGSSRIMKMNTNYTTIMKESDRSRNLSYSQQYQQQQQQQEQKTEQKQNDFLEKVEIFEKPTSQYHMENNFECDFLNELYQLEITLLKNGVFQFNWIQINHESRLPFVANFCLFSINNKSLIIIGGEGHNPEGPSEPEDEGEFLDKIFCYNVEERVGFCVAEARSLPSSDTPKAFMVGSSLMIYDGRVTEEKQSKRKMVELHEFKLESRDHSSQERYKTINFDNLCESCEEKWTTAKARGIIYKKNEKKVPVETRVALDRINVTTTMKTQEYIPNLRAILDDLSQMLLIEKNESVGAYIFGQALDILLNKHTIAYADFQLLNKSLVFYGQVNCSAESLVLDLEDEIATSVVYKMALFAKNCMGSSKMFFKCSSGLYLLAIPYPNSDSTAWIEHSKDIYFYKISNLGMVNQNFENILENNNFVIEFSFEMYPGFYKQEVQAFQNTITLPISKEFQGVSLSPLLYDLRLFFSFFYQQFEFDFQLRVQNQNLDLFSLKKLIKGLPFKIRQGRLGDPVSMFMVDLEPSMDPGHPFFEYFSKKKTMFSYLEGSMIQCLQEPSSRAILIISTTSTNDFYGEQEQSEAFYQFRWQSGQCC